MKSADVRKRIAGALEEPAPPVVPGRLGSLDISMLPPVLPPAQPVHETHHRHVAKVYPDDNDHLGQMDRLTSKALNTIEKVLDFDDVPDPETLKLLQIQHSAATTMLNTTLKANDTALRARAIDVLPEILRVMKEQQARLPKIIDHV